MNDSIVRRVSCGDNAEANCSLHDSQPTKIAYYQIEYERF